MSEKSTISLICPGPDGWVAWQLGENAEWVQTGQLPPESKPWELPQAKGAWILALPYRSLQTLAFKVPATEQTKLEDVVPLRMEAAGLDGGGDGVVLTDWELVGQSSDSRTVTVWAMDAGVLDGCPLNRLPDMVVPGMARWVWGPKQLTFWQEAGRWVVAFSGDGFPVHVQPCAGTEHGAALAADLQGQVMTLLLRGLAAAPQKIVVRGGGAGFAAELGRQFGLPVEEIPDAPQLMPARSRLVSKEMLAANRAAIEAVKWRKRLAVVAVLWLGLAGYGGWRYAQARAAWDAAQQEHEQVMPRDRGLKDIQQTWDEILLVNSVEAFPLEVLKRLSKTMPPEDFRLTVFTVESTRNVYLKGSAKRPDLALRFAQDLRRDKELAAYAWETPYPVNEKDGTATFTYQGKFRQNTP